MLVVFEGIDGAGKRPSRGEWVQSWREGQKAVFVEKQSSRFSTEYLTTRMTMLRQVIWKYSDHQDDYELGDKHFLYIMASWFAALDQGMIRPLLADGYTVVVDSWFYKFIARFYRYFPHEVLFWKSFATKFHCAFRRKSESGSSTQESFFPRRKRQLPSSFGYIPRDRATRLRSSDAVGAKKRYRQPNTEDRDAVAVQLWLF